MNFNNNTVEELQTLIGKKVGLSATDRIINQYKVIPNNSYTILEVTAENKLCLQPSDNNSGAIELPISVNGFLWGIKNVFND